MRCLSGLLSISLLVLLFLTTISFAQLPGNGTSSSPYRIESQAHFQEFCDYANANIYWAENVYTELCCDLSLLNAFYNQAMVGGELLADQPAAGFQGDGYSGQFDGQGYTISSFVLKDTSGKESFLGVFGVVNTNSVVKNLKIENVYLQPTSGTTFISPLVAFNNGTISNCTVQLDTFSSVSAFKIGAICGNNTGTISQCSVVGKMNFERTHYIAGICGFNEGTIKQCSADIILTGHSNVAGISGTSNYASIEDCYCHGQIVGINAVAGISGQHLLSTITRCYSCATVEGDLYDGEIVGHDAGTEIDCYYNKQIELKAKSDAQPLTTEQMYLSENYHNWDFTDSDGTPEVWVELAEDYPQLRWQVQYVSVPNVAGMDLQAAITAIRDASLTVGEITYQPSLTLREDAVISSDPSAWLYLRQGASVSLLVSAGAPYSGGDGSVTAPYILSSPSDIIDLHSTPSDFDKNFVLANDISLDGHIFRKAIVSYVNSGGFSGIFDGANHAISGVVIDVVNDYSANSYDDICLGLFGQIASGAQVKDLAVSGKIIAVAISDKVGGLCAVNSGNISNCNASFEIHGRSSLGGLCGYNNPSGTIHKCFTDGNLSGISNLGGLCGTNAGTITRSFSNSDVVVLNNGTIAGGFCGEILENAIVNNCYCTGNVKCGTYCEYIGGFAGKYFCVTNSYCSGQIIPANGCTNLAYFGYNISGSSTCYYKAYDTVYNIYRFTQPLTNWQMRDSAYFPGWDFINTWQLSFGNPPQLRTYSSSDINSDSKVDLIDLSVLAENWLME